MAPFQAASNKQQLAKSGDTEPVSLVRSTNDSPQSRQSNHQHKDVHHLDRFGFIVNMDMHGKVIPIDESIEAAGQKIPTFTEVLRTKRREKKWDNMMDRWTVRDKKNAVRYANLHRRKVVTRLRKGVPDHQRGQVWQWLARVPQKMAGNKGLYQKLVRTAVVGDSSLQEEPQNTTTTTVQTTDTAASSDRQDYMVMHSKSFKNIQDTIERDIHRTFPRHNIFHEDDEETSAGDTDGELGSSAADISNIINELEQGINDKRFDPPKPDLMVPELVLDAAGGQASLRRVLKAYSVYDREVGYCQGMNFVAGMFLTLMPEEEAFWLLVSVMQEEPCRMRELFGEGMRETHLVLHVADELIKLFLPKLSKHLEQEHVHITMFATQWLLTQYTSSFRFELVTRVWDAFLGEGWKITYRVMLAILKRHEAAILLMSFEEILSFFRELPDRVEGPAIMEAALKIPLKRSQMAKLEKEWNTQQAREHDTSREGDR